MSATPPSMTPATARTRPDVDVSEGSDRDLEGRGVRVAHGDLDGGDGDGGDGAGDGRGGEGARDGAGADVCILPLPARTFPIAVVERGSELAVAAILKHDRLRLGAVDGCVQALVVPQYAWDVGNGACDHLSLARAVLRRRCSVRLPSLRIHILSRRVARVVRLRMYVRIYPLSPPPFRSSVSTAVDPLIERDRQWLRAAPVRERARRRCRY
ncbi:hypothetical protein B0H13DRAFT_1114642 [Mycena leptocephala]|nr:hypothetical protein B0H13DRAFT_1114642 [Mycena leptocephala]